MADLHESHEEQVERTVSSPEAVTEYLNGYVRPYRIWYERTAKRNYRYLSLTRSIAITTGVLATVFAACPDTVAKALSPFGTELTRYLAAIFSAFATGIRDAAVLFRASGSYPGSGPREMLLC